MAEFLLPNELEVAHFVNADVIAKALSPHAPEASAFDAGRFMLRRIRELRERHMSFAFETTLVSKTFERFLREAQAVGYLVQIIYVSLVNPDLAVQRVHLRVEKGGHDIPETTVRRRYGRSLANFFRLYRPLADGWSMWDNSGQALVPIARSDMVCGTFVFDDVRWGRMLRQARADER